VKKFMLGSVIGVAVVSIGGVGASAVPNLPAAAPAAVTCFASSTGVIGQGGPQGATGATGPQGDTGAVIINGAPRSVHVRGVTPDCGTLAGVCLTGVNAGDPGVAGPPGATGPQGDTGGVPVNGAPRSVHVRGIFDPCAGIPFTCVYGLRGPNGATGPIGDTGVQGATGAYVGAGTARRAHARPAGIGSQLSGQDITLGDCNLPETGGSGTSFLPYALLLVAVGGVVAMVADRRRRPNNV